MITALLIVGIIFAVLLADRLGRIWLQIIGFFGCALGLLLASFSVDLTGGAKVFVIFAGFMLFNFMTNLGPNAQTYLLAGEVFPTAIRGQGAGFAAAFAKIGAGGDRLPVPHPAGRHRHPLPALRADHHLRAGRRGDLGQPDRDQRRQSGQDGRVAGYNAAARRAPGRKVRRRRDAAAQRAFRAYRRL